MRLGLFLLIIFFASTALADEVYLKNGDKITGNIIYDSTSRLVIQTEAMGEVTIRREHVKDYKTDKELAAEPEKEESDVEWTRKVNVGYSQSGGNTKESDGTAEIFVNRKTGDDEATFKWRALIETNNDKLTRRKFYSMGRYARSFGQEKKWYHFGKLEASQDTTMNIRYRLTPAYGVGYWFADRDDFKAMAEGAFGWETTHYDDGTASESGAVFTPRGYLEKTFADGLKFSEDFTLYPSLKNTGEFRLRSETALKGKITEDLTWVFQFLDEYDSAPVTGRKKNDYELTTGLEYAF